MPEPRRTDDPRACFLRGRVLHGPVVFSCVLAFALALSLGRAGADALASLGDGAFAVLKQGRMLFLECEPSSSEGAEVYLAKFLADPKEWSVYAGKGRLVIRFGKLSEQTQRSLLLAVFPDDFVDDSGWHHVVRFAGQERETLWTLSEWLTGTGASYRRVAEVNRLGSTVLYEGQCLLFPHELLKSAMREVTERAAFVQEPEMEWARLGAEDISIVHRDGRDYALYRLKPGEALYTAVAVRFTDFRDNAAILDACKQIQQASGIKDVHAMEPGTEVLIPVTMLSDRYRPEGSPERRQYEEVIREAARLRGQVRSENLDGVVVILDSGHGGRDQGAAIETASFQIYEDEVNYDIVCRIKRLLETQTRARVHVLNADRSQGYAPCSTKRFQHDTDEELLTHPRYENTDATTSANLRAYLANSIYLEAIKNGVDPRKVVFTSIHTDAIFNAQVRGAMIYIPGARYRRDEERPKPYSRYTKYAEVLARPRFTCSASERTRDEALSRNFASVVLAELGKHQIKRHDRGDPIRNVIRKSRRQEYVPAVLRNTMVPTKLLVETANMQNPTDCRWLSEPWWRQRFAEAYVSALQEFYGS